MATAAGANGNPAAAGANGAADARVARLRDAMARADGGRGVQVCCGGKPAPKPRWASSCLWLCAMLAASVCRRMAVQATHASQAVAAAWVPATTASDRRPPNPHPRAPDKIYFLRAGENPTNYTSANTFKPTFVPRLTLCPLKTPT